MTRVLCFALMLSICSATCGQLRETLPPLDGKPAAQDFQQMWAGFDPRAEPLEVEILKEWEEDEVVLRIVRFRIGVFKGKKSTLAAVYGFPKEAQAIPGLVQIHGGGQYADHRACLMNAKHGYATVSISWAGRISAPGYRVSPAEVQLFWDGKTDAANYRRTTDWGAVDGYHAPSRNRGNNFPSASPAAWTIDPVESPRNSPWFLCAVAARRALTFLEQQPEVDAKRLGVYGHSMGGKLTVMTSFDERVKAAAPSCGGISDRRNASELFESTICDNISLQELSCPIIFLSPSNDFHGRIGDLPQAINEIKSTQWRVTCSPHLNHQDLQEYEVASLLWFDQHLKGSFVVPNTPRTQLTLKTDSGIPTIKVRPDTSRPIQSVDVFFSQHGKDNETAADREDTICRFWRHASASQDGDYWTADLSVTGIDRPLWVYANVKYELDETVSGAGYYYGIYSTDSFNVSSLLDTVSATKLQASGVKAAPRSSLVIEDFGNGWQKEWFSTKPQTWPRATHKVFDDQWKAPIGSKLVFNVRTEDSNSLVVRIDEYVAEVALTGGTQWQQVVLTSADFKNVVNEPLNDWNNIRQLKLSDLERLRPGRGQDVEARVVGAKWSGRDPEFSDLRWSVN